MHLKKERRCVACRITKNQDEMIRVAKYKDNFYVDFEHKLDGRGAYVCKNAECINNAIKKRAFNRAFKTNVSEEIYTILGEHE